MSKNNDMVSVLDTVIGGRDEKYEGVMKKHREHYSQFYGIYKGLNINSEDIVYEAINDNTASFKITGVNVDDVVKNVAVSGRCKPLNHVVVDVDKGSDHVLVNITIN